MNMRERIWRCIQQQNLDNGGAPIPNTEAGKIADAVIDALMEPTEGMIGAFDNDFPAWINEEIEDPMHLYTAMIKAAKEGK